MDIKTFPYRLDDRTRNAIAGIMQALIQSGAKLQSTSTPFTILFDNKENGVPMDSHIWMNNRGINLVYRMNNVAGTNQKAMQWLKQYNGFISRKLKANAVPAAERCTVLVEATYSGQVNYYFTYMMRYDDDSLAQDMPQTELYASEPLYLAPGASKQAVQAPPAQPAQQASTREQASWL